MDRPSCPCSSSLSSLKNVDERLLDAEPCAEGARFELGFKSCSPFTSSVGVTSLTGPPTCCGTCNCNFEGRPCWVECECSCRLMVETAEAGVEGGKRKCCSDMGGSECARSIIGVRPGVLLFISMVGPSLVLGLAGNVTNGPSRTERLLGGLPRSFPLEELLLLGQADDTAGPCRRRDRDFEVDGVTADWGSSNGNSGGRADCGVTADIECGVDGLSWVFSRHRSCCPAADRGVAE